MSDEKPINERVSVLETRTMHHERRLDDNSRLIIDFFKRFDQHVIDEADADARLEFALNSLIDKTNITNETLEKIKVQGDTATKDIDVVKTIWATLSKVAVILVMAITALWTVYTYINDPHIATVQTK